MDTKASRWDAKLSVLTFTVYRAWAIGRQVSDNACQAVRVCDKGGAYADLSR